MKSVNECQQLIHHNLFITLLFGSMLISVLAIPRVKCIVIIGKSVSSDHLGSTTDPCYIQNRVIMNRVIKRLRCNNYTC